jgi:hypothetical protein
MFLARVTACSAPGESGPVMYLNALSASVSMISPLR